MSTFCGLNRRGVSHAAAAFLLVFAVGSAPAVAGGDKLSEVRVYHRDGSAASGLRVALGFDGLFGGVTVAVYTDRNGVALIEHASSGKAHVYVDGSDVQTFDAPGRTVVRLK